MSARWPGRAAWSVAALSACLAAAYVVILRIDVLSGRNANIDDHWLPGVVSAISYPVLGAVVLSKHPRNRLAWVFVLIGLGAALGLFTEQYALHGTLVRPGALPAVTAVAWLGVVVGNVAWVSTPLLPQLFPDGRPLSVRWRWLLRLTLLLIVLGALSFAIRPGRLNPGVPGDNPFALDASLWKQLHGLRAVAGYLLGPAAAVVILGSLVSLVLRYRRARGASRQQMKLFVASFVFFAAALFVYPYFPYPFITNALISLVPPVAFGVAMMRYRLYDIDRVISRTFAYAVLTGLLLAVYVVLVTAVTRLLPHGSSLAVAIATLGVAALFQPLRRRVQGVVDHRFNRARFDAERTIDDFARRLRSEVALETVRTDLLGVIEQTMQPAHAGLWLRSGEVRQ
ncbi:MAG: hypothetical protein M3140_07225 [Actinomycetota bacterium]|nr:hypothetical protein [Actinomycetota bacterium]